MQEAVEEQRIWYGGLELIHARPLSSAEKLQLDRMLRRLRLRALIYLLITPMILGLMVAEYSGVAWLPHDPEVLAFALFALFGLLLAVALYNALTLLFQSELLRREQRLSLLLRCQGTAGELIVDRRSHRILSTSGILPKASATEVEVEVLSTSAILWAMNGRRVGDWIRLPHGTTAAAPEHALIASRWMRRVETTDGTVHLHRRQLSEPEREELQSYLPRNVMTWVIIATLLNACVVASAILAIRSISHLFLTFSLLAAAIAVDLHLARMLRFGRRLRSDAGEQWVVIVRDSENEEKTSEYLPTSGIEWSRNSRPSSWRKILPR